MDKKSILMVFASATQPWKSRWFVERDYDKLLLEDIKLKNELKEKLKSAGVSSIEIERPGNKLPHYYQDGASRNHHRTQGRGDRQAESRSAEAHVARNVLSISRKCTSRSSMRNWFPKRLLCNWKSGLASGGRCARRWIRLCALVARGSSAGERTVKRK